MKKNVWMLAILAFSTALCAQETGQLGKADLLAAFKQYNPAALEKASADKLYGEILNKLAAGYSAPNTEEERYELIGLAKNFDNSLRLQLLRENYFQGRTLQLVSGTELAALRQQTYAALVTVFEDIFKNTLQLKQLQLADYKQQFKQNRTPQLKEQIRQLKQEIAQFKRHSRQKIQATAEVYLAQLEAAYQATLSQQLQVEQSANRDIKANHKKPVAE